MYAVVGAVKNLRVVLLGLEILLWTDDMALERLLNRDLPLTTRIEQWILRLSKSSFLKEHQKKENILADVL